MRNFETLFKEAQFYIEADRRIGSNTLYFWYKDLPEEEQEVLRTGSIDAVERITKAFSDFGKVAADVGQRIFENLRLALESINLGSGTNE